MKDISQADLEKNIPLVAKRREGDKITVRVGAHEIGGEKLTIIVGPCTVETREQVLDIAKHVKEIGAVALRGGAFKPATISSPR